AAPVPIPKTLNKRQSLPVLVGCGRLSRASEPRPAAVLTPLKLNQSSVAADLFDLHDCLQTDSGSDSQHVQHATPEQLSLHSRAGETKKTPLVPPPLCRVALKQKVVR
ncbi:hypothetical protein BaRGS_00028863, partial [Batillaria attramentaria]